MHAAQNDKEHRPVTLTTPWGADLDPDAVLQDYPRPQLVRDSYLNLNGYWQYAITSVRRDAPPADGEWDGRILVPFSPEAPLSGVNRQLQPQQILWYRRTLRLPEGFAGERVLLHFGAVDHSCTVTVNGVAVGGHDGGYLPFTLDITDALVDGPEQEITVRVRDISDTGYHSRGKQKLDRGGIWYTAQSGIWQTVWPLRQPSRPPALQPPQPSRPPALQPPQPSTKSSSGSATSVTPATPAAASRHWTAAASGTPHNPASGRPSGWNRCRAPAFPGWTWSRTSTPSP